MITYNFIFVLFFSDDTSCHMQTNVLHDKIGLNAKCQAGHLNYIASPKLGLHIQNVH